MQRATSWLPSWDKTKTTSKKGFDKTWAWADKLGAPVNRWTNKIGSEAFWPMTLDKECDKAARILKTFCKDGFYAEEDRRMTTDGPNAKSKQRVVKKIPQKVIENAVGLAIFTTMRTGLWVSGAGGSGILIARKEDGTWSPPSGIMLHTAGLGFLVGVDIYDCVLVINNRKALDSFTKIRATVGGEISAVAGPVGVGGVLENDGKWKQANRPVFTYLKSRGFYAGVQVDGTVIIERTDENERFYGQRIGVTDILAGKVRHVPYDTKLLMETIKAAEGRSDVDQKMLEQLADEPSPADVELQPPTTDPGPTFGIPEPDDPDPFGVLALEKAGLEIREAGTRMRPISTQFEYHPSPTSPAYSRFNRRSIDTQASKSNRESYMSNKTWISTDRATQTTEAGTQTDDSFTPHTSSPSSSPSHRSVDHRIIEEDEKSLVMEPEDVDYTKIDLGPYQSLNHSQELDGIAKNDKNRSKLDDEKRKESIDDISDDDDDLDEEPVVFEAASAQATVLTPQTMKAKAGVVNIPKRGPPPPLPPRNLLRTSKASSVQSMDQASGSSSPKEPKETKESRGGFEEVALHGVERNSVERTSIERSSFDIKSIERPILPTEDADSAKSSKSSTSSKSVKPQNEHDLNKEIEEELMDQHLEEIESVGDEVNINEKVTELMNLQEELEKEKKEKKVDENLVNAKIPGSF